MRREPSRRPWMPAFFLPAAAVFALAAPAASQPLAEAGAEQIAHGKRIYEIHCARCHGLDGVGGEGPNLMRENLRRSTQDDALIGIRSKDRAPPALAFESDTGRNALKWGSLIGVPALFMLFGFVRVTQRATRAERRWNEGAEESEGGR